MLSSAVSSKLVSVRVAPSMVDCRVSPSAVDMFSMKDHENQCQMLTTENVLHILQASYKKLELAFNTLLVYYFLDKFLSHCLGPSGSCL